MPYEIVQVGTYPRRYSVVNIVTGEVHAKNTTLAKAEAQIRLLRAVEHGWKPTSYKY
jgi:hypothetical protein